MTRLLRSVRAVGSSVAQWVSGQPWDATAAVGFLALLLGLLLIYPPLPLLVGGLVLMGIGLVGGRPQRRED